MNTVDDVLAFVNQYLSSLEVTGSPERLNGGLLNYVWRLPARPEPVIIKYAPPYIASAPTVPLDPSRIRIEADALSLFGPNGSFSTLATPGIRPPRVLYHSNTRHVVVLEDIGPFSPLDQWLKSSAVETGAAGSALGTFIGSLHRLSIKQEELAHSFNNQAIQRTRQTVQYNVIRALCKEAHLPDADACGDHAEALGRFLLEPGLCLIMGDLWPASILHAAPGIRLIDWEFAHYGQPFQDVAHLAAHLWMLQHKHPPSRAEVSRYWHHFWEAYVAAVGEHFAVFWSPPQFEMALTHLGAEILVRTVGPFKERFLFDGHPSSDPVLLAALDFARQALLHEVAFEIAIPGLH